MSGHADGLPVNLDGKLIELHRHGDEITAHSLDRSSTLPPGLVSVGEAVYASAATPENDNGFGDRVESKRLKLVEIIRNGLPEVEYLPASDGMLVRGKRHMIAAPRKTGKSIAMLVHWTRMAFEGATVVIFDRENGGEVYAQRLESIMTAWGLTKGQQDKVERNLRYYQFPMLRKGDVMALHRFAKGVDVVVFDSQRMFLHDLGVREDDSDGYAEFMGELIDPIFRAGVATVILDNTGHSVPNRGRGSSSKGDLNEVLFSMKVVDPFSRDHIGRVELSLPAGDSRFGDEGRWEMTIGGGAFAPWKPVGADPVNEAERAAFREATIEVLKAAGGEPLSQTKLLAAIRGSGITFKQSAGRDFLISFARDPDDAILMDSPEGRGRPAMFFLSPPSP